MCNCPGRRTPVGNVTKVTMVKLHYLGGFEEPFIFMGVATGEPYKFGGRINLGEVDSRDLTIGQSTHPGLLELTDNKGQKLFELWTTETQEQWREQLKDQAKAEEKRWKAKQKPADSAKSADEDTDSAD
jgi:hypothetical protein